MHDRTVITAKNVVQNRPGHTSAAEMKPLPSLSNTLKASRNSSSESESCSTITMAESRPCRYSCPVPLALPAGHYAALTTLLQGFAGRRAAFQNSPAELTFIFLAIRFRNSGKSMVPLPSASTSLIISCSSASVGFCPRERITVPSSFVVIVPARQQSPELWRRPASSGRFSMQYP